MSKTKRCRPRWLFNPILEYLLAEGESSQTEIVNDLGINKGDTSVALHELESRGVVCCRTDGYRNYWSASSNFESNRRTKRPRSAVDQFLSRGIA